MPVVVAGCAWDLPEPDTPADDLVAFARQRTASWDGRTTAVPHTTAADTVATTLRATPQVPPIPAHRGVPVAFLGDAVHAMSPAGGDGANTAFGDAALLLAHLRTEPDVSPAIAHYHHDMPITAGEALRRSAGYAAPQEPTRV
jgi:2-polyprenyl-6-methoxyphenol hydroxylase-like FAD-dependent oxidoreductase